MAIDSRASHRCDVPIIEPRWSVVFFSWETKRFPLGLGGARVKMLETAEVLEVYTPRKTNMAMENMENGPVEDVFPIQNGDFLLRLPCLVYWRVVPKQN